MASPASATEEGQAEEEENHTSLNLKRTSEESRAAPGASSVVRDLGQYASTCGYCDSEREHANKGMVALKLSHEHYQVRQDRDTEKREREKEKWRRHSTQNSTGETEKLKFYFFSLLLLLFFFPRKSKTGASRQSMEALWEPIISL